MLSTVNNGTPLRRFLSNYFDLLLTIHFGSRCIYYMRCFSLCNLCVNLVAHWLSSLLLDQSHARTRTPAQLRNVKSHRWKVWYESSVSRQPNASNNWSVIVRFWIVRSGILAPPWGALPSIHAGGFSFPHFLTWCIPSLSWPLPCKFSFWIF